MYVFNLFENIAVLEKIGNKILSTYIVPSVFKVFHIYIMLL